MAKSAKYNIVSQERKCWGFLGLPLTFTVYSITDKKLLIKKGFLSRQYDEIMLYRITDLQFSQTFAQTVFGLGLGTVTVFSKDTSDSTLVIKNIRHPRDFYETLSDKIERERLRYGVRPSELIGSGIGGDADGDTADLGDHFGA